MRAQTAVRCYFDDCYEEVTVLVKLHRRDEPLLALPTMAACFDHITYVVSRACEFLIEEDDCTGLTVVQS